VVPDVLTSISPDLIRQEVEEALPQIIEVLTTEVSSQDTSPALSIKPATVENFSGADRYEAAEQFNEAFLSNGWGDGFPLIPPTEDGVARMLKGTTRSAQDVVTVMTPGSGIATVEKIAINAMMASCRPEHLPLVIAAVEAFEALGYANRALAMSTSPHAPLLVVNGPIVKELGMNYGRCTLGPGVQSRVNIAIGRALRLCMMNIGQCYPGHMDMDTIGSSRKFTLCAAENEAASPWEPLHVEKGLHREASALTLFPTRDEIDVNDLENWTPEGVLNSLAFYSAIPGGDYISGKIIKERGKSGTVVFLSPDHARVMGNAGWDKTAVKDYLWNHSRATARELMNKWRCTPDKVKPQWRWLLELSSSDSDHLMLPVMESPDCYTLVVVGGPAGKDLIFRTIAPSVTVEIKDRQSPS
jgi:hypothetical protein